MRGGIEQGRAATGGRERGRHATGALLLKVQDTYVKEVAERAAVETGVAVRAVHGERLTGPSLSVGKDAHWVDAMNVGGERCRCRACCWFPTQ